MKLSSDDLLVFIHGFNVSFEEAILRSGQLAFDLAFRGPVLSFSWPSEGDLLDYGKDITNSQRAVPHLRQFLIDIRTRVGARKVHVIAHSMGNRVFTEALASMARDFPALNQVILAAPDIDKVVFEKQIAPRIMGKTQRTTLYASSKDKALQVSKKIYGDYPRAGMVTGRQITVAQGVDTVDVSMIDGGWLEYLTINHSAYGDELIDDLFLLVRHGHAPPDRNLLLSQDGKHWIFAR